MNIEAKNKLKQLLGAYDEKLTDGERRDAANRAAQEAFPVRFAALRAEKIRPVIQEFVEELNGRGHEASVLEQEESSSSVAGVAVAAIPLRVVPKPFAHKSAEASKNFIEVRFSANRGERKVTVSSTNTLSNSGASSLGKRGEHEIDAVTADVVADHLLRTLEEGLAGKR